MRAHGFVAGGLLIAACHGGTVSMPAGKPSGLDGSAAAAPAVVEGERLTGALVRLDALFGTSGELPQGGGSTRVVAFMRDRMKQAKFYDNVIPKMFRQSFLSDGNFAVKILSEGSDAGGSFLYRFAPCPPEDRVMVKPWWSFDGSQVSICTTDYRPEVQTATLNGASFFCETAGIINNRDMACGCGAHLVNCAPPKVAEKLALAIADEPVRTAQEIIQNRRPFSELLTANATVRSGWGDFFYARSRFFETGTFEFSEPEEPFKPTSRPRAPEYTGGILTTPRLRYWDTPRAELSYAMQEFMCVANASQDVKAAETLKLAVPTSQQGLFFLASRPGCENCHARLENAMRAFSGWPYGLIGFRYVRANAFAGEIEFYVRDHHDLRAKGPATAEWFGHTMAAQPEFPECITRRVEELVYAGYAVPPAEHARLAHRFGQRMDFADLVEQVVLSWLSTAAEGDQEIPGTPSPGGDPGKAGDVLHELLVENCTTCHHARATGIPSFEAPLDRRMTLRVGLYVDNDRMPPTGHTLLPGAKRQIVQSVCTVLGEKVCRNSFLSVQEPEPVRTGAELLRVVEQRTDRKVPAGSVAATFVENYAPTGAHHQDVMSELTGILLSADQCPNDHGSSPSAMRSCTQTILNSETIRTPPPPGRAAHGHR